MDRVYIISRYRANTEKEREFNREVARYYCRKMIEDGKVPVAPHLYYTQFLDDDYPAEREAGLCLGLEDLRSCQEFFIVVIDGNISEGMKEEIAEVGRLGLTGRIVCMTGQEIREVVKVVR